MSQITIQNAERSWTEILRKVLESEETIIEQDGKPVAKVSPVKDKKTGLEWMTAKFGWLMIFTKHRKNFLRS